MKIGLRGVLGFALSAFMLWYALRDVNVAEVSHALAQANIGLLVLASAAGTSIFFLRAVRWRPILAGVVPKLPYGPLFRAISIGMALNNLVPARAGEIARAFALNRERRDVPFSAAFASIAVDRIFDAAVVVGLMLIGMMDPAFPRDTPIAGYSALRWIGVSTAVLGVVLVALAALA
ncbi:MAG: flippase-like domain-containing protein, partial [Gemmatimonadetes bacterium]|nr:flippase-like domain-containing protein [Gemmatimonadota bacterium]